MLQLPRRLQSIDVLRAVTMFFMIFVNDVDGVTNIPEWIKHVGEHADGLGFADTVFPAFLFIVGLSVPFALSKRMQSGEKKSTIAFHILLRSAALIIMGFFHVNLENYSTAALLPEPLFEIIITAAFFLIWLDYAPSFKKIYRHILQATGIIILLVMAFLYKGESHEHIVGMHKQWWGILGLIGWGYLTCSLVYLFSDGKFAVQVTAFILFFGYNTIVHAFYTTCVSFIERNFWFISSGSEISLIMAGIVISLIYKSNINSNKKNFFGLMILLGTVMIAVGFITRPIAGISKINDTPAWVGICTGISILVFTLFIFLVDVKGKANWFSIIKPAGTSTLTCYLLPYFLYSFLALSNINYPDFFNEGIGGIMRSFATAFIVIFITGLLEKQQLRLKL